MVRSGKRHPTWSPLTDYPHIRFGALVECSWHNGVVKYATAVRRLGSVAESLSSVASFDDALITDAYMFGDILNGPESLDVVSVAFVVDLPVLEVSWCARPVRSEALAEYLRMDKVPVSRWWRPAGWPVWNHEIVKAVRIWSQPAGVDEDVLAPVAQRRFDELSYVEPSSRDQYLEQLRTERRVARQHLNEVLDRYHERDWQRSHRSLGMYPEDHLWWAAEAFRELDEAVRDELSDRD
jgi:hypothetical protein